MTGTEHFVGVSALLIDSAGVLLEVQKAHKWRRDGNGRLRIGLGFVGGNLEDGETPIAGLQREACEEIGCGLRLESASQTIEISPEGRPQTIPWAEAGPRPILTWEGRGPGHIPNAKVAVYIAQPDGMPEPGDLPAILRTGVTDMLRIGSTPMTVADFIAGGAQLRQREPIPPNGEFELVGTPAVLYRLSTEYREISDGILAEVKAEARS